MGYDAHLRDTARHRAEMAAAPGELGLGQAKLREAELIASDRMYAVLPELIRQERARMRAEGASDADRNQELVSGTDRHGADGR